MVWTKFGQSKRPIQLHAGRRNNGYGSELLAKSYGGHAVHIGVMSQEVLAYMQTFVVIVDHDPETSEINLYMCCFWTDESSRA